MKGRTAKQHNITYIKVIINTQISNPNAQQYFSNQTNSSMTSIYFNPIRIILLACLSAVSSSIVIQPILSPELMAANILGSYNYIYSIAWNILHLSITEDNCTQLNGYRFLSTPINGITVPLCQTCDENQYRDGNDCRCVAGSNRNVNGTCIMGGPYDPQYPDPVGFIITGFLPCSKNMHLNISGQCTCDNPNGIYMPSDPEICVPNPCRGDSYWNYPRTQCLCNNQSLHYIGNECTDCPSYSYWKQSPNPYDRGACTCVTGAILSFGICKMCDSNSTTNAIKTGCVCNKGYVGNGWRCRKLRLPSF